MHAIEFGNAVGIEETFDIFCINFKYSNPTRVQLGHNNLFCTFYIVVDGISLKIANCVIIIVQPLRL